MAVAHTEKGHDTMTTTSSTYHIASLQPRITMIDLLTDTPSNRVFVAVEADREAAIARAAEWSGQHPERPVVWVSGIVVSGDGCCIRVDRLDGVTPVRAGIRERIGSAPAPLVGTAAYFGECEPCSD